MERSTLLKDVRYSYIENVIVISFETELTDKAETNKCSRDKGKNILLFVQTIKI